MAVKDIIALEERRWTAVLDGDVDTLNELYSPDLAYTHTDGKLDTRDQYLKPLAEGLFRYTAADRSNVEYRDHGDAVVITGRIDLDIEAGPHQIRKPMQFTAVWSFADGQWQLIAWHANELAQ